MGKQIMFRQGENGGDIAYSRRRKRLDDAVAEVRRHLDLVESHARYQQRVRKNPTLLGHVRDAQWALRDLKKLIENVKRVFLTTRRMKGQPKRVRDRDHENKVMRRLLNVRMAGVEKVQRAGALKSYADDALGKLERPPTLRP